MAASFCALLEEHAIYRRLSTMESRLLATAHVALAIGLVFVIVVLTVDEVVDACSDWSRQKGPSTVA